MKYLKGASALVGVAAVIGGEIIILRSSILFGTLLALGGLYILFKSVREKTVATEGGGNGS